jgi:hypothetical protein
MCVTICISVQEAAKEEDGRDRKVTSDMVRVLYHANCNLRPRTNFYVSDMQVDDPI